MRDQKIYSDDKLDELKLLNNYLKQPEVLPAFITSTEQLVEMKYKIKQLMKAQTLKESVYFSETTFDNKKSRSFASHKMTSSYQRFDLNVIHENILKDLYRIENGEMKSNGIYTTCGMAAILAVLHGMKKEFKSLDIVIPSDSYFETIYYIENYLPEFKISYSHFSGNNNFKVLWYDTLSNHDFFELVNSVDKNPDFVVVDTTLYELGSKKLKEILSWLKETKTPAFWVRSHIKLDSLASEYGRLGSLVLLYQKEYSKEKLNTVLKIAINVKDFVSRSGLNFFPLSLFPLQKSNEFHQLNTKRIDCIRTNSKFIILRLKEIFKNESSVGIFDYQHQFFLTLELASLTSRKLSVEKVKNLVEMLNNNGVMARFAGSFAFDFIALDSFKDYVTGRERIRISFSDQPLAPIENALETIVAFIHRELSYAA